MDIPSGLMILSRGVALSTIRMLGSIAFVWRILDLRHMMMRKLPDTTSEPEQQQRVDMVLDRVLGICGHCRHGFEYHRDMPFSSYSICIECRIPNGPVSPKEQRCPLMKRR